jgi:hypothetical protein
MQRAHQLILRTLQLYRTHFWTFVGYAAWPLLPTAAILLLYVALQDSFWIYAALPLSLVVLFTYLWTIAILIKTADQLDDQKLVDPKKHSKEIIDRVPTLLLTYVLKGLIITGGLLLLIVPGIIFAVWYALAHVVVVLTGKESIESLAYAKELVKGRFWTVLWLLVAGTISIYGLYVATTIGLISLVSVMQGLKPLDILGSQTIFVWPEAIQAVLDVFFLSPMMIYYTLLYKQLRNTALEPNKEVA